MEVILSITWASAYQSVRGLVLHYAASWRAAGLDLVELNLSDKGWPDQFGQLLQTRRIRFVFCTSGIGAAIEVDGQNLWEKLNLPLFSLLLDHPAYFAAHHRTQPANVVLGYMFQDHAQYQADEVRAGNLVTSLHYGIPDLPVRKADAGRPRIVFAKTGNCPDVLAASWRAAPKLEAILRDALDELALTTCGNAHAGQFHPLLVRVAAAHNVFLQPFSQLSRFLVAQLDDYLRRRKSTAIARALLPFEVDVFGRAWEHIDTGGARARFHGPVDYATVEGQFPGATASLTMNPNIDLSAHDRFFTALGAGIMPLSDRNAYTEANFPELLPYCFDFMPGSIESAIEHVLADPDATRELARATRARARGPHGVETAAADIVQTMQAAAFAGTVRDEQKFFVP
ncbi:MAG: hypothetical protein PHU07_00955 [Acidocella sp.]|nr:hypothetical protein [Acidocella sp.]